MFNVHITETEASFRYGNLTCGIYRYRDSHKPHLHPLRTPEGHRVTVASPHDHRHHKGMMYALRSKEVNFWEEVVTLPDEVVGVMKHQAFSDIVASGEKVGFSETLHWSAEDGSIPSFNEVRDIRLQRLESGAFEWTWSTRLESLRDQELIQSQWSHDHGDGRITNYHGLGLRLRAEFGGPVGVACGHTKLILDDHETTAAEAMGTAPTSSRYEGGIDGFIPAKRAAVILSQHHGHTLYAQTELFAWMSMGPSNQSALQIREGQVLEETYTVTVEDL